MTQFLELWVQKHPQTLIGCIIKIIIKQLVMMVLLLLCDYETLFTFFLEYSDVKTPSLMCNFFKYMDYLVVSRGIQFTDQDINFRESLLSGITFAKLKIMDDLQKLSNVLSV